MNFATIKAIYDDGVTLLFDDGTTSQKHYPVNSFAVFNAGDRVRILEDGNNSYVVEYTVGKPKKTFVADSAKSTSEAKTADKLKTARTIKLSGDISGSATFDGSGNIEIKVTAIRCAALKNQYASTNTNFDVKFYAQNTTQLYYRVGSGALTKLQNG